MRLIKYNGQEDYGKLNHLPFNRKFKVRKDLIDSMNKRGFTVPVILIKTSIISGRMETFLADGQHRAITAAFLDIPFYGTLVDNEFETIEEIVEFVASLNSAHKSWINDDYATAYAYLGMKDYTKLISITQKTTYSLTTIAHLLYGIRSNSTVTEHIKKGKFVVNLERETDYTLTLAAKLSKFEQLTSRMVLALHYVSQLSSFSEERFTQQYELNAKAIKELNLDDYSDIFSSWL